MNLINKHLYFLDGKPAMYLGTDFEWCNDQFLMLDTQKVVSIDLDDEDCHVNIVRCPNTYTYSVTYTRQYQQETTND